MLSRPGFPRGHRFPSGAHVAAGPPVGRKWRARSWGRGSGGGRRRRCPFLTGVSLSLSLGTAAARPKPREAVAPQRRPAPRRPGEPLPVGGRHHAPGRRQLPREAPRGRRPGAPARRPGPPQARAPVSAAAGRRDDASPEHRSDTSGASPRPALQTLLLLLLLLGALREAALAAPPQPRRTGLTPELGPQRPGSTCALGRRGGWPRRRCCSRSMTSSPCRPTPRLGEPCPGRCHPLPSAT